MFFAGILHIFPTYQCLQKRARDFLKFYLDLELLAKIKKTWFLHTLFHNFINNSWSKQSLNCSSKTKKFMKMSTSPSRKEHLYLRTPAGGFFLRLWNHHVFEPKKTSKKYFNTSLGLDIEYTFSQSTSDKISLNSCIESAFITLFLLLFLIAGIKSVFHRNSRNWKVVRNVCFWNTSRIFLVSKGVSDDVINEYNILFCNCGRFVYCTLGTKLYWNIKFTKPLTCTFDW